MNSETSRPSKTRKCPKNSKDIYPTYADALAEIDMRNRGAGFVQELTGSAFSCEACSGWHISKRRFTLTKKKGRGKQRRRLLDNLG
jgi:hypothetical protein